MAAGGRLPAALHLGLIRAAILIAADLGIVAADRVRATASTLLLVEPVDPVIDELRLEFRRAFRDVITETISRGIASGELPPQNASVVAAALVGAFGEALIGPLATGTEDPDTIPTLIQFTLRAIGGAVDAHA